MFPNTSGSIQLDRETKYADKHEDVLVATSTTVDERFSFWIGNIVGDLAPNTLRNYRERYIRKHSTGRRSHNYNQYALILETGLRTSEMIGLIWNVVDFENRTLTVIKSITTRLGVQDSLRRISAIAPL